MKSAYETGTGMDIGHTITEVLISTDYFQFHDQDLLFHVLEQFYITVTSIISQKTFRNFRILKISRRILN